MNGAGSGFFPRRTGGKILRTVRKGDIMFTKLFCNGQFMKRCAKPEWRSTSVATPSVILMPPIYFSYALKHLLGMCLIQTVEHAGILKKIFMYILVLKRLGI